MSGAFKEGGPRAGGPTRIPQGARGAADSSVNAVREDYKSEASVALHEVRTLPVGREVYVQLGGVFLLADANTAEGRILQQQQEQQEQ